jgi:hypothetical protein
LIYPPPVLPANWVPALRMQEPAFLYGPPVNEALFGAALPEGKTDDVMIHNFHVLQTSGGSAGDLLPDFHSTR